VALLVKDNVNHFSGSLINSQDDSVLNHHKTPSKEREKSLKVVPNIYYFDLRQFILTFISKLDMTR
jgi:hypothetical protein